MKVGTVTALTVYPVKSMRGVALERAQGYWYGLNGDRKYAFVRGEARSGFPWLTARGLPRLLSYKPYFEDATDPLASAVWVKTPEGEDVAAHAGELAASLSEQSGERVSLFRLKRGTFDCMPVSLITTQTLHAVGAEVGRVLDSSRFRANLVVDAAHEAVFSERGAFPEQAWLGRRLRFGNRADSLLLALNYPTTRCAVVNLDPADGAPDASVLKAVTRLTGAQAGVYGTVHRLGDVRLGDTVFLES